MGKILSKALKGLAFLCFSLGALSSYVLAQGHTDRLILAESGYYRKESLPEVPRRLENALLSSVEISISKRSRNPDDESRCSGILVNKSGYVLTAAHCVWDCLVENNLASTIQFKSNFAMIVKQTLPQGVGCAIRLPEYHVEGADLVQVGAAQVLSETKNLSDSQREALLGMAKFDEDFALLKFDLQLPRVAKSCLKIADQSPALGERIWAIGHPARTIGRGEFNSLGNGLEYISYGRVQSFYSEHLFASPAEANYLKLFYDQNPYSRIFASTDAFRGNSGGMLTNGNSELVGVVSQVYCPKNYGGTYDTNPCFSKYFSGNTMATSAAYIRQQVLLKQGASRAAEIFDCRD